MPLVGLAFSPDGEQIAAIVRTDVVRGRGAALVLVVKTKMPDSPARIFETRATLGSDSPGKDFSWSPAGGAIDAGGTVVRLSDGSFCSLPEFGGFLTDDDIVAYTTFPSTLSSSHFAIFGADCKMKAGWEAPERWLPIDISAQRKQLFIEQPERLGVPHETLLVNPLDGRVLQRWQGNFRPYGRFANSGKNICGPVSTARQPRRSVGCWDTDTGQLASVAKVNLGSPFAVSARSARVIVSDYRYFPEFIRDDDHNVFKELVVWDFGTNRKVTSWRPGFQANESEPWSDGRTPRHLKEMNKFAISPDGLYVVEGGNGILRLYKISQ